MLTPSMILSFLGLPSNSAIDIYIQSTSYDVIELFRGELTYLRRKRNVTASNDHVCTRIAKKQSTDRL